MSDQKTTAYQRKVLDALAKGARIVVEREPPHRYRVDEPGTPSWYVRRDVMGTLIDSGRVHVEGFEVVLGEVCDA